VIRPQRAILWLRLRPRCPAGANRTGEGLRHLPGKAATDFRGTRELRFAVIACALLLGGFSGFAWATGSDAGDVVLRALREEMERSKEKLKLDNVAAPYYLEYRVTEIDQLEASAVFGALRSKQWERARVLRVVVRVGDYRQDSFFGSGEGTIDLVPLDDDVFAIRRRIWLATDRAYKAASEALAAKQAALKQLKVDEPVDDFTRASPLQVIEPLAHFSSTDFSFWIHLLEQSSGQYRRDTQLESVDAGLRFTVENRYFLNSEGTVSRSGRTHFVISIAGSTQASDGMLLQRSHADQGNDLRELPTRDEFLKTTARMLETLRLLRDAPLVDEEYRGPVLFSNDAAATVVTELVAPNVLGKKPQVGENARTTGKWSSSYKSRVLPDFVEVFDDPALSAINGQPLFGSYTIDDEGVKAERVSLIEKGQLVSYLLGRQPIRDFPASNGHGRAAANASPSPAPGNMILQSKDPQPDAGLKGKLIDLCRKRDLPYGLYVETMGPGMQPRLLYRLWIKDGREELVRGGVFGDLDVRSLRSDLVAAGTAPAIEDRSDPVWFSVASPALLFDELQIKRTQAAKPELPEYPAPGLGATERP
jgi:hypothetical protein